VRVWIDLANSPHVVLFDALVSALEPTGHEFVITARDHAQTRELAVLRWPDVRVVGTASPAERLRKVQQLMRRTRELAAFARSEQIDVALSHGSYAQLVAARLTGIPAVTMMDYEHQPANHLSFRLAHRVVVPEVFPEPDLRRAGAQARKVLRYAGFKEEIYLAGFRPDPAIIEELKLDRERVLIVMRPAPEGALYHRDMNPRFEQVVDAAQSRPDTQVVILPRTDAQRERYARLQNATIPRRAIDARSLLAYADVTVGAGGTMNRESCLLGTPTYTVFSGRLAAVDAELMRIGILHDLRDGLVVPSFEKKSGNHVTALQREPIVNAVTAGLDACSQG
jgi:predicted glycosyltransferase